MTRFVLAIDQGTTSTRAIIFDVEGKIHASAQKEHRQIFPRAGWVEHDGEEIWLVTREVVGLALARGELTAGDLAAVGIANQRETTIIWEIGRPSCRERVASWSDACGQKVA